jgi:RNA polymerase sigma-70 factor (ECF subfamily)
MTRPIPERWRDELAELHACAANDLFLFAFSTLVQGHGESAYDLVQDVYCAAALGWGSLRLLDRDRQRAWLFRTLKNKAIDRWRESKREHVGPESAPARWSSDRDDTHDKALTLIVLERCWKVLAAMPARQFRVAYLRWHEGWSSAEIAEHLGIACSTVRVHLKNARDELRRAVGPDVTFLSVPESGEEAVS